MRINITFAKSQYVKIRRFAKTLDRFPGTVCRKIIVDFVNESPLIKRAMMHGRKK